VTLTWSVVNDGVRKSFLDSWLRIASYRSLTGISNGVIYSIIYAVCYYSKLNDSVVAISR